MLQVEQVCSWSAGSSFSVILSKFKQPYSLGDPGLMGYLESTPLELSNDVFEIPVSITEKIPNVFQYRNLL